MIRTVLVCALAALLSATAVVAAQNPTLAWKYGIAGGKITFGIPDLNKDGSIIVQSAQFVTGENKLLQLSYALNATTGVPLWFKDSTAAAQYPTVGSENTYLVTENGIQAVKTLTGAAQWSYNNSALPRLPCAGGWPGKATFIPATAENALKHDIVMATWYNTPAVVLDAATGKVLHTTAFTVGGRIWLVNQSFVAFTVVDKCKREDVPSIPMYAATMFDLRGLIPQNDNNKTIISGGLVWKTPSLQPGWTNFAVDGAVAASKGPAPPRSSHPLTFRIFDITTGKVVVDLLTPTSTWDYNVAKGRVFRAYNIGPNATAVTAYNDRGEELWTNKDQITTGQGFNCFAANDLVVLQGETVNIGLDAQTGKVVWQIAANSPAYGAASPNGEYYFFGEQDFGQQIYPHLAAYKL